MSLDTYKQKRNFKESPEPTGGKANSKQLHFVIQKHDATNLHYDFRLEMDDVLKSWAVPKGPSTDPSVKRLAIMVEDHPYDYREFEGVIPSGYGAGTVIVWDEGYYEPAEDAGKTKKANDRLLQSQLKDGKLKITLHGEKLKGDYALVKAKGRGDNGWLLFKIKDEYASKTDITRKARSVISDKTLDEMAKDPGQVYEANEEQKKPAKKSTATVNTSKKQLVKKASAKKKAPLKNDIKKILAGAPPGKFPSAIKPMLATLIKEPPDGDDWICEVKWDGYRTLAYINKGKVQLQSRNNNSFNEKFYPIVDALKQWDGQAVLDGEVVVLDDKGISDFGALQNWRSEADGNLFFYVFDILWLDGKKLEDLPLLKRKQLLEHLQFNESSIRLSEGFGEPAEDFFNSAQQLGLEGIIAKKSTSVYEPGARSSAWLKVKVNNRQEMVIAGYTKNEDSPRVFSSLVMGVYNKKELQYMGKVGTGFNAATRKKMMKEFKPRVTKKSPFRQEPDVNKPSRFKPVGNDASVTWLKPELVCEVKYTELTKDGVMRHPVFIGMRSDKDASAVIKETPAATTKTTSSTKRKKIKEMVTPTSKQERKSLLNPTDKTQQKKLNGHELNFTNLDKIYWPKEKISKRDLINYYYQVAAFILPYLKDRPQSMNRFPNGINGKSFYYKDVSGSAPGWASTYKYRREEDNRLRHYLVATNEASLLYMANLGCIEMNPWSSRVNKEDNPDWCIIDLDPGKKNSFDDVIAAALATKTVLEELGVQGYPKTSGSTGIHIYIPLGARYSYEQSKQFAALVAQLVQERLPAITSVERIIKNRKGKMYIDFLQNRSHATVASPYSLRPKPGAPVSMPLHWEEVKKGLAITDFTIYNALDRLKSEGDIFKPVLGKGINLTKLIRDFEEKK